MDAEVGSDLLQGHTGIAVPGDPDDVVSVLAGTATSFQARSGASQLDCQ
ncbi:hypothetical protein OG218_26455 [Kineococcus sp. NBC_00420]